MVFRNCPIQIFKKGNILTFQFQFTKSNHRIDKKMLDDIFYQMTDNFTDITYIGKKYHPSFGKKLDDIDLNNPKLKEVLNRVIDKERILFLD